MRKRPVAYSPKLAERVCAAIAAGETVLELTRRPGMPERATVFLWRSKRPEFRALYEAACRERRGRLGRGVSGRPSLYSPRLGERVCDLIAAGASLSQLAERPSLPSHRTMSRWIVEEPAFRRAYMDACHVRGARLADEVLEIADASPADIGLARAKVMIAARMWLYAKLEPRKWRWDAGRD